MNKLLIVFFSLLLSFALGYAQGDNSPDPMVNLALTEDATVTGSVPDNVGRGIPEDILWDPAANDWATESSWHEYGMAYDSIAYVSKEDPLWWQVVWETDKNINYINVTGVYGNQAQPTTGWAVQIMVDGEWQDMAKSDQGWDADTLRGVGFGSETQTNWTWDGQLNWKGIEPVVTKGVRLLAYANPDSQALTLLGEKDPSFADSLWSFAWSGRSFGPGTPKSALFQYLDFSEEEADNVMDKNVNLALLDEAVISASFNFIPDDPDFHNGRGQPIDIQYDPVKDDYHNKNTAWGEFGYAYDSYQGFPEGPDDGFWYQMEWPIPKMINYFTWGGIYGNQPQPDTPWELQYWDEDGESWETLLDGVGGSWEDAGTDTLWPYYAARGVSSDALSIWMSVEPVTTKKLRFAAWSDGITELWSFVLRCRGGDAISNQDADNGRGTYAEDGNGFKAVLVQYINVDELLAIESPDVGQPSQFALNQNYPNPFNPQTNIEFVLPKATHVKLSIYNILGQEVAVLVNEKRAGGAHHVTFDASGLSSGVYYYRIDSDAGVMTKKMMVIK
jgi:hypothetical protein